MTTQNVLNQVPDALAGLTFVADSAPDTRQTAISHTYFQRNHNLP